MRGPSFGLGFKVAAGEVEGHDHGRNSGVVFDMDEEGSKAAQVGGNGAKRNERIHVGGEHFNGFKGRFIGW